MSFTRALVPWQRAEVRYFRLEVCAQDLVYDSPRFTDWVQLCRHLAGTRGLRLTISMEGGVAWDDSRVGPSGSEQRRLQQSGSRIKDAHELVRARRAWIRQGLGKLEKLEQLEVELADIEWTIAEKTGWSEELRDLLMASHLAHHEATEAKLEVVCVRKAQREAWPTSTGVGR